MKKIIAPVLFGLTLLVGGCANGQDGPVRQAAPAPTTTAPTTSHNYKYSPGDTGSTTSTTPAKPTSPNGNVIKKIDEPAWVSPEYAPVTDAPTPADSQFTVTKIAKQKGKTPYSGESVMVVMYHVKTGTDPAMAEELSMNLSPVIYTTDSDTGERLTPGGAQTVGTFPSRFGTNKEYEFGFEFDLSQIHDHGWLTVNSNGGRGGGWDYEYDLR